MESFAANLAKKRKFNQIVLIDPLLEKNKEVKKVINDQILHLNSSFDTKKYTVDLIIMRQVLEHVKDPTNFFKALF